MALFLFGGVQYYTGQSRPSRQLHISGDIRLVSIPVLKPLEKNPLAFHDWELDIACWCSHKYIMARSRAIGGLSVHKKHTLPISALLGWRDL